MSTTVDDGTSIFVSSNGENLFICSDSAREADPGEIPTVSLNAPLQVLVAELREACTRGSALYIKDHDICQTIIDEMLSGAKEFFKQTSEQKIQLHHSKNQLLRGYEGFEEIIVDSTRKPDLHESFGWAYDAELDPEKSSIMATADKEVQSSNIWPRVPELKETVSSCYTALLTLSRRLLQLLALALHLPGTYFDAVFRPPSATCRIIHYPPQKPNDSSTLGIGAHQDIECFTILCQGEEAGLHFLNSNGEWIEVPPVPGALVLIIGDLMARWSNDTFPSTLHRVINRTGRSRHTVAFFFGPSHEADIIPLTTCINDGEVARYEPIRAGEYVMRRLKAQKLDVDE